MKRNTWIGLGACVLIVGGGTTWVLTHKSDEVKFRTAKLEKGSIRQRISATGTLNAIVQVAVGTQVSGIVTSLSADYNSLVEKGQVIAEIDPTPWQQAVRDAEASLQRAKVSFEQARINVERSRKLHSQHLISTQDLETSQLAFDTSRTQFESAKVGLEKARTNLGYCIIKAPVSGVVVARSADLGQTVAASFSTPNLFSIAQDLSKMKLEVSIDEADIGQVKLGQSAMFTVDSYPDRQFRGRVAQVRLEPITQQNVVTYKVVMEVDNQPIDLAPEAKPEAKTEGKPEAKQDAKAAAKPEGRKEGQARPEGQGGEGHGGGFRSMDPAQREAMFKKMGIKPEDMQDPAKREAIREKFRAMREQMGGSRPVAKMSAAAPQKGGVRALKINSNEPRGLNFASGPVYQGNLALRPGMTANVTIMTNQKDDVLRVPTAALRFNPEAILAAQNPKKDDAPKNGQQQGQGGQRQGGGQGQGGAQAGMPARGGRGGMMRQRVDKVWIMGPDGKPKAIEVKAGLSDGQFTEVSGEGLTEGMEILVGIQEAKKETNGQRPQSLTGGPGMPRR